MKSLLNWIGQLFEKVDVMPIVSQHFSTFQTKAGGKTRVLKRDIIVFYVLPMVFALLLVGYLPSPSSSFLSINLTIHTLFIPLLVNVLFVIYGIQEKQGNEGKTYREVELLRQLYKNVSYSVLVSFLSVILTAATQLLIDSTSGSLPSWIHSCSINILTTGMYWLIGHLLLTVLMIVKRTSALLDKEVL